MLVPRVVCVVSTNKDGVLELEESLLPNCQYSIIKHEESEIVRPYDTRYQVAEWVESCVIGDLRTLRLGMAVRWLTLPPFQIPTPFGGGNFLLAAGACMAIEYFGQVHGVGANGTERAKNFVAKFLAPVDARYLSFFELIWSAFRNGIVHGSWTQSIEVVEDEGAPVGVGVSVSAVGPHFAPHPSAVGPSFVLNAETTVDDLHRAFQLHFKPWILNESDEGILARASAPLLKVKPTNKNFSEQVAVVRGWTRSK